MSEKPILSKDFLGQYNDVLRRLRAVEREFLTNPDLFDPLQTFEDGSPLGDTRFLNFGAGLRATLTGDGYVTVDGSSSLSVFDALVDRSLSASDTNSSPPQFRDVGEASDYLFNNGFGLADSSCIIAVRPAGFGNTYVEAANWNSPANVRLFGLRGSPTGSQADLGYPTWSIGNFRPIQSVNLRVDNMKVDVNQSTASQRFANVWCYDTNFVLRNSSAVAFCTTLWATGGTFDFVGGGDMRVTVSSLILQQCDAAIRGVAVPQVFIPCTTTTGNQFLGRQVRMVSGAIGGAITLPEQVDIEISDMLNRAPGTGGAGALTFNCLASAATSVRIVGTSRSAALDIVVNAAGAFSKMVLEGVVGPLTLTGAHDALSVQGLNDGETWDIRGPGVVACSARAGAVLRIRGEGLSSYIGGDALTGSSGAVIDHVGADDCTTVAALDGTGTTGTKKAVAFDASSDNNVVVLAGRGSFPAAYADAGTNNRVLPEGSVPFTTDGHVIEDEGTPLTQRANMDFVGAGVTATDAGGKTVVTIPGGSGSFGSPIESQFGDVGSDGTGSGDAAENDHVHDRHDDGVLYYSGINH